MTPQEVYTPEQAYWKALKAGKRLPELEDIILTSPWFSCLYAERVIKDRWEEAEDIIMIHPAYVCFYAFVIKGKLPEKMHNMMLLNCIKYPDNQYVKEYFELLSESFRYV